MFQEMRFYGSHSMYLYYECKNAKSAKSFKVMWSTLCLDHDVTLCLVRTWRGRIGQPGVMVVYGYRTPEEAHRKIKRIHAQRLRHGYVRLFQASLEQLAFAFEDYVEGYQQLDLALDLKNGPGRLLQHR